MNTLKHADRVLQGMGGWDPVEKAAGAREGGAKAAKAVAAKQKAKPRRARS